MRHRRRSDDNDVISVLFAVAQGDGGYFKPAYARRILESASAELRAALGARELMLTTETCRAGYCNMGACHDLLILSDTEVRRMREKTIVNLQLTGCGNHRRRSRICITATRAFLRVPMQRRLQWRSV